MPIHLDKIYTRTGDQGKTSIADGQRLDKSASRIQALGDVDELNCQLGVFGAYLKEDSIKAQILAIQSLLFEIGAELAIPSSLRIQIADVEQLEQQLDHYNATLPTLKSFILPAGNPLISHCHLSRAVCRRAERQLWALNASDELNPHSLKFINRLSDYLFVLARYLGQQNHITESLWQMRT